jgi:hypothetical protein
MLIRSLNTEYGSRYMPWNLQRPCTGNCTLNHHIHPNALTTEYNRVGLVSVTLHFQTTYFVFYNFTNN